MLYFLMGRMAKSRELGCKKVFHLLLIPAKLKSRRVKTILGGPRPMEFKDHPLWRFTLKAHRRSGVHEACVELQKSHGIDVNFLFWCCWVAQMGAPPLHEAQMRRAMTAVRSWQEEIVRPVWRARWKLKPSYGNFPEDLTEALRRQLIAAEINAEHLEMLQLADAVKIRMKETVSTREKVSHAMENVKRYLSYFFKENAENEFPRNIQPPLSTILCACFPELKEKEMFAILKEHLKKGYGDTLKHE